MMTRSGGDRQPFEPDRARATFTILKFPGGDQHHRIRRIFCPAEEPSRDAVDQVHRLSHGLAADEVLEVVEGS
jgi:hypothetical protein